jgi:hypothetical protein
MFADEAMGVMLPARRASTAILGTSFGEIVTILDMSRVRGTLLIKLEVRPTNRAEEVTGEPCGVNDSASD